MTTCDALNSYDWTSKFLTYDVTCSSMNCRYREMHEINVKTINSNIFIFTQINRPFFNSEAKFAFLKFVFSVNDSFVALFISWIRIPFHKLTTKLCVFCSRFLEEKSCELSNSVLSEFIISQRSITFVLVYALLLSCDLRNGLAFGRNILNKVTEVASMLDSEKVKTNAFETEKLAPCIHELKHLSQQLKTILTVDR